MAEAPPITKGAGPGQLPQGGAAEVNELPQTMSAEAGAAEVEQGAQAAGEGTPGTAQASAPTGGDQGPGGPQEPGSQPDILSALAGAGPPQAPVNWAPSNDDEKSLFAPPTSRAGYQAGGSLTGDTLQIPPEVNAILPGISMAAAEPNAAPQVKMLAGLLAHHAFTASQGG